MNEISKLLLKAAIEYQERGWCVIPINPGSKKPFIKWRKYQKQLPTQIEIKSWWSKWPTASIGILCGEVSDGLAVLDVDDEHLGEEICKLNIETTIVKSPKGFHFYFKETEALSSTKNLRQLGVAADLRANKGIIIVPPSKGYEFISNKKVLSVPNALDKARELFSKAGITLSNNSESGNGVSCHDKAIINNGQRNDTLFKRACSLRDEGYDRKHIAEQVHELNQEFCNPPMGVQEVEKVIASALSYPTRGSEFYSYPYNIDSVRIEYIDIEKRLKQESPKLDWLWEGILARQLVTLLSAHPWAGKTTLTSHFLKAFLQGDKTFLDLPIDQKGKVLYLTQESEILFLDRCKKLGLKSENLIPLFKYNLNGGWTKVLEQIERDIQEKRMDVSLVVVDTISSFWEVKDEWNGSEVTKAVRPLMDFAQRNNVSVLVNHHFNKTATKKDRNLKVPEQQVGSSPRGSNALTAEVDIAIEMRSGNKENYRVIATQSRLKETPKEIMAELREDGYCSLGSRNQLDKENVLERALEVMSFEDESYESIYNKLSEPKPSKNNIKKILDDASEQEDGRVIRTGKGVKGNPHLYKKGK